MNRIKNKQSINLFIILIGIGLFLPACNKKGCIDGTAENYNPKAKTDDGSCNYKICDTCWTPFTINGVPYRQLNANVTEDTYMDAESNWLLSGGTFVDPGVTLTIEAGTTIHAADDGTVPFLSISRGAKIVAIGTADKPIVFTSIRSTPAPGDWGGIVINGEAKVNMEFCEGEGGTGTYGGSNDNDNSGILKYVRVEYAGKLLSTDNQMNGFSFNALGNETTLDYLQTYKCADDGFNFIGGTVSLKHAISSGNRGDGFDCNFGWTGTGSNWIVEQEVGKGHTPVEIENNSNHVFWGPKTNPILSNVTIIGAGSDHGKEGLKICEGAGGSFSNFLISEVKDGVKIKDDATGISVTDEILVLSDIAIIGEVLNDYRIIMSLGTDSTNTYNLLENAINGLGIGAGTDWALSWSKDL